ncbi:MAG: phosphatase PAP2 family protein [Armatimonadetes bacterium]|jgi:diacylglycerol kinase (ATP)|nr:phosphatase PAP2 family protein [Armatimonadota bacterium]
MRFLRNPMNGFKYAVEGVVHVFRTQRHMRFHFLTMVLVLVVSLVFKLKREEVIVLLFTITLVLAAEMFNTAIEAVVDLVTQTYHPLAKFAKDIASGAVLITAINALAIGFLLFPGGQRLNLLSEELGLHVPDWPTVGSVTFLLLGIMVLMWKVAGRKGKLLKGGVVSGHSAVGFFLATTIVFMSGRVAIGIMAFMLAVLVAQSRVEGGIHTLAEVVLGALLATGVACVVYGVLSPVFPL